MPIETATYAPSKTLYALDLASFTVSPTSFGQAVTMDAVWTVRKKGRMQVCIGRLYQSYMNDKWDFRDPMGHFFSTFDGRYGGNPDARWDGAYMWAPDTTLSRMNDLSAILDPILSNLPAVPAGYDGWYRLT